MTLTQILLGLLAWVAAFLIVYAVSYVAINFYAPTDAERADRDAKRLIRRANKSTHRRAF